MLLFLGGDSILFVMSTGTGGGARVAGMSAQLDVDALPLFVGHGRFVTSGPLHFGVKQEQIHWKTICVKMFNFIYSTRIESESSYVA